MGETGAPTVLKLGGSYALCDELKSWVAAIAECAGRVVVVPGGGPFAEAVWQAQRRMQFDDKAAHHMALLAMTQYGCALSSFCPRFALAQSAEEIAALLARERVPVWSPVPMALSAAELPASWEVSSDTLAAWLAGSIGASRVMLVKRVAFLGERVALADLVSGGIVDSFLPQLLQAGGPEAYLLGPQHHAVAAAAIQAGRGAGIRLEIG